MSSVVLTCQVLLGTGNKYSGAQHQVSILGSLHLMRDKYQSQIGCVCYEEKGDGRVKTGALLARACIYFCAGCLLHDSSL